MYFLIIGVRIFSVFLMVSVSSGVSQEEIPGPACLSPGRPPGGGAI